MAVDSASRSPWTLTITALLVVVACLLLGRWQVGRVYRPVDSYSAEPAAVPLQDLVPLGADAPRSAVSRQVTVSGRYLAADQVTVAGHLLGGQPVSWVVTPLLMPDRSEVLVVRGWVDSGSAGLAAPPTTPVSVTGRIETGEVVPAAGSVAAGSARLRSGYLIRTAQTPPDPLSLQPVPAAAPANNSPPQFHLQNAIYVTQWFLLALVIAVCWWRLLRAGQQTAEAASTPLETVG
jgi:cytochrome oxidase assembly protein ShyY1